MKKKLSIKSVLQFSVLGLILLPSTVFCQELIKKTTLFSDWSVSINGGANLFFGDIQQNQYLPEMEDIKLAYGIIIRKQLSPVLGFGGQILNGQLHGHKKSSNLYFDADIFEYGMNFTVNISNLFWPQNLYRKLSFYGIAGIGITKWRTTLRDITTNNIIQTKGQGKFKDRISETVIPLGIGFKYNLGNLISLNFESTFRTINTDLLDLVEGGYKYDMYSYNSLGITLYLDQLKYVSFFPGNPEKQRERMIKKQEEGRTKENKAEQRRINKELRKSRKINKKTKRLPKLIEYGSGISFAEPDEKKIFKTTVDTRINTSSSKHAKGIPEYEGRFQVIGGTAGATYMPDAKQTEAAFSSTGPLITRKINIGSNHSNKRSSYSYPTTQSFSSGNSNDYETPDNKDKTSTQVTPITSRQQIETLVFRVQILASNEKINNAQSILSKHNISGQIFEYHINSIYRYSVGAFRSFSEALNYCQKVKNKGIRDAFVVAYKNGIKVSVKGVLKK